ncbi:kinesin motor domain-containing protein [Seiridium cupressi]
MLTKRFSGKVMLPGLMFAWGSMALVQNAAKNFAGLLVIRLLLGRAFEAGFFAGTVFYLTLFYTRGELGFRIALYFGSALLASAFSGLISFGVFQIKHTALQGWQWLFIIEGAITVVVAFVGFFWLPASSSTAWFLTEPEREVARLRSLRDASRKVDTEFSLRESFQTWTDWKFPIWCIISFTYPVAFSTCANFLPIVLQRLGYSTVVTNLLTVPPNCCGFLVLLAVTYSSDRLRERTYHIVFSLVLSFVGLIILATVDGLTHRGVAYFACFLVASGAYIPSCLVHSWHNNNNLNENSRAANTGLLVGLGNLGGILSAATFRTEYAPRVQNMAGYKMKGCTPPPVSRTVTAATGTNSPDMVVSARIRPMLEEDVAAGFPCAIFPRSVHTGIVDVHDLYNHPRGRPVLKSSNYQVDELFDSETTTEDIYAKLIDRLIPFARDGGIGTVFAYGQTGSGKTFTISRIEELVAETLMDGSLGGQREVYITIIDLAGNSAHDLLNSRKPFLVLEDSFGVTQLAGANEDLVQDKADIMTLIRRAASFRRTAPTHKNDVSSRSHGICRIRIKDQSTDSDGFLYLVDLAGSEAARDRANHGAERMREAREINMSLSVLKDCIRGKVESDTLTLSDGPKPKQKRPHVPFRQSALTKVLKHVFDPASSRPCKTAVIACVNPVLADVGPSKNTLRYAEMLRVLLPADKAAKYNPSAPMTWNNSQLKDWMAKNSGIPPLLPSTVAPTESGAQLLRLSTAEFESRCLKSPGSSIERARAIRSKLWQMHIDFQHVGNTSAPRTATASKYPIQSGTRSSTEEAPGRNSSRDLNSSATEMPFKERIRPGMVVSWNGSSEHCSALRLPEGLKLAVILCPAESVKDTLINVIDLADNEHAKAKETGKQGIIRYLCALLTPGLMAEAYELNLWRQIIIDVNMMEGEVILEYDAGTRYYYISV